MRGSTGKCKPNCQCGRHRGGTLGYPRQPVAFRERFFAVMPPPYLCARCGNPIPAGAYWQDGDALVLLRRDGNPENTAVGNLAPVHRRCQAALLRLADAVTCQCGLVTNAGAMAGHQRRTGHQKTVLSRGDTSWTAPASRATAR